MFENATIYDKAAVRSMTQAFIRKFQRKRYLLRKYFYIGVGLLGTLCGLLLLLVFDTLDLGEKLICFFSLAVCVPALLKGLFLRRIMAWSTGWSLRKSGGPLERRFVFSEESFRAAQSGMETAYQYEMVKGIYETGEHFVLQLNAQTGVILDKAGFSRGTPEGFRDFMERKLGKPAERVR